MPIEVPPNTEYIGFSGKSQLSCHLGSIFIYFPPGNQAALKEVAGEAFDPRGVWSVKEVDEKKGRCKLLRVVSSSTKCLMLQNETLPLDCVLENASESAWGNDRGRGPIGRAI